MAATFYIDPTTGQPGLNIGPDGLYPPGSVFPQGYMNPYAVPPGVATPGLVPPLGVGQLPMTSMAAGAIAGYLFGKKEDKGGLYGAIGAVAGYFFPVIG